MHTTKKQDSYSTRELVKARKKLHETQRQLKELQKEYNVQSDVVATLTQENLELGKRVKDYQARFEKGGLAVAVNNGYVTAIGVIPPYSEYTWLQDYPSDIGTKRYSACPYVKLEERTITIDKTKYKKYIGGL